MGLIFQSLHTHSCNNRHLHNFFYITWKIIQLKNYYSNWAEQPVSSSRTHQQLQNNIGGYKNIITINAFILLLNQVKCLNIHHLGTQPVQTWCECMIVWSECLCMSGDVWQHSGITWIHWISLIPSPGLLAHCNKYSQQHRTTYSHCSYHLTKTIDMLSLYRDWIFHWTFGKIKTDPSYVLCK